MPKNNEVMIALREENESLESSLSKVKLQLKEANLLVEELRDSLQREQKRSAETGTHTHAHALTLIYFTHLSS